MSNAWTKVPLHLQHLMSKFENSENTNKKSIKIVGTLDSSNNGPSPPNAEIICVRI